SMDSLVRSRNGRTAIDLTGLALVGPGLTASPRIRSASRTRRDRPAQSARMEFVRRGERSGGPSADDDVALVLGGQLVPAVVPMLGGKLVPAVGLDAGLVSSGPGEPPRELTATPAGTSGSSTD